VTIFIPVASGKGGTGKTVFSANLGVDLARRGKTVILIDLDLGGSNLHTCLGVTNEHPGIGNLIYKREPNIQALLIATEYGRLHFIPGDALIPGTANLDFSSKKRLLKAIGSLIADYVIMDLGSGSSFNTTDFFLLASNGFVVTTPEITAILNAYSFIKTSLYRLLYLSYPAKSDERKAIAEFMTSQIEGEKKSFLSLIDILSGVSVESGILAKKQMKSFSPRILVNMVKTTGDISVGEKLNQIVVRNLGIDTEYFGQLIFDPSLPLSIATRKPQVIVSPKAPYSTSIDTLAKKLIIRAHGTILPFYESEEDFEELGKNMSVL
jgi:flagellar biosynthesis protein FlhG